MHVDTGVVLYKLAGEFELGRNTMEERLRLQKTVYLLQACGLRLGYGFSWYRYGPYSQDLVYDAYKVLHSEQKDYRQEAEGIEFSPETKEWLETFKRMLGKTLNDTRKLELLASVGFVQRTWHPGLRGFVKEFKLHKNRFFDGEPIPDDQIEAAYEELHKLREALPKSN